VAAATQKFFPNLHLKEKIISLDDIYSLPLSGFLFHFGCTALRWMDTYALQRLVPNLYHGLASVN